MSASPAAAAPSLVFQAADGLPVYLGLDATETAAAARALASAWRTLGTRRGDVVLIYDYGTSPLTLFASWCFAPYLRRGAAELVGAVPICNDGLPEFASRALHVLRHLRPRITITDRSHLPLLARRAAADGVTLGGWTELLAISPDEETMAPAEAAAWSGDLGVPVRMLLRSGPALFFAAECGAGSLHADPRFYRIEALSGGRARPTGTGALRITNRFLCTTPAVDHVVPLDVSIGQGSCPCGHPGRPFTCLP